jgi:soluble lytic murein transglycosylase-like protein
MPLRLILRLLIVGLCMLRPSMSNAASYAWVQPAIQTCEALGVPGLLAVAVILTESRGQPYAVRVNAGSGVAVYPATYEGAQRVATTGLALTDSLDLGLMQINYRHQGRPRGFTPAELLQPHINLRVGCTVLKEALASGGPTWQRIGRYHSRDPAHQLAYALRVTRWLDHLLTTQQQ